MQCLGTRCLFSTAHHPQTDGQTERVHRSLQQVLRALCTQGKTDWVRALPLAEFAINTTVLVSMGTSPFTAIYGTDDAVRLPIDNALRSAPDNPAAKDIA